MPFVNPKDSLERLGIRAGSYVVDLGAGSGHYTLAVAHMVGEDGRVYAVELQRELARRIQSEAREQHLDNIDVLCGDISEAHGTSLKDACADVVILSNILFQIEDKAGVVAESDRILKQGGRVLVIEWKDSFEGLGPQEADVVPEADIRALFETKRYELVDAFLAGDYHYGLIYRKP